MSEHCGFKAHKGIIYEVWSAYQHTQQNLGDASRLYRLATPSFWSNHYFVNVE